MPSDIIVSGIMLCVITPGIIMLSVILKSVIMLILMLILRFYKLNFVLYKGLKYTLKLQKSFIRLVPRFFFFRLLGSFPPSGDTLRNTQDDLSRLNQRHLVSMLKNVVFFCIRHLRVVYTGESFQ
jgi:hypothetical protein